LGTSNHLQGNKSANKQSFYQQQFVPTVQLTPLAPFTWASTTMARNHHHWQSPSINNKVNATNNNTQARTTTLTLGIKHNANAKQQQSR